MNGSIAGDALVNSGATLGGNGNILGSVTVDNGGIFSPGNSPGTLTIGSFTLYENAVLNIEIGTVSDHVIVNGDLTLDGTLNLFGDPEAFTGGSSLSFLYFSGKLSDHELVIGSVPEGFSASNFALDFSRAGVIGVTSVPLPSSLILLITGLLCMGSFSRRPLSTSIRQKPHNQSVLARLPH